MSMNCWFCYETVTDYILLPEKEDIFEIPDNKIPNNKNVYQIINIDKFKFLYYTVCNPCLTMYLDNYPINFKKIIRREIKGF